MDAPVVKNGNKYMVRRETSPQGPQNCAPHVRYGLFFGICGTAADTLTME
jgi:hypothetical protein